MTTLTVKPKNKKELLMAQKALKAINIDFVKEENGEEDVYSPEFVESILQGREDYKNGKGKEITLEELRALCE
ncbi:MAG: DUF2683 family protein [Fusobacteriaceae bacterium]